MSTLFRDILTSNLSATSVMTLNAPQGGRPLCGVIYIRPIDTALLSSITVTVRWDDGQSKFHTDLALLSTANMYIGTQFLMLESDLTDVTIEATIVGAGTADVGFFASDLS